MPMPTQALSKHHLLAIITRVENALLIGMLALMVLLADLQIILRDFIDISIYGADQILRLLVLWVAYLGAVAASRDGKHIRVDAIVRWLPGRLRACAEALTDLFTSGVCVLLAWQALRFMASARMSGEMVFGSLPVWVAELILPLGFAMIALRYFLRLLHHLRQAMGRETNQ
jgi:TRAP-type C4-dicarboxylate transport system permease small subunit